MMQIRPHPGEGPPGRKRGLLSYITHPLSPRSYIRRPRHQNVYAARAIRRAMRSCGLRVEASDYRETFVPPGPYSLAFGFGYPLEYLTQDEHRECFVVSYSTGAARQFLVERELERIQVVADKTGLTITPERTPPDLAHFYSGDAIITTGNSFTEQTYQGFGGAVASLPEPYPRRLAQPGVASARDWRVAKRRALYIASSGLALKGLDLVIDAFALVDVRLTVAVRPSASEAALVDFYKKSSTSNITWIDGVNFLDSSWLVQEIFLNHGVAISASASEGGPGSVIIPALNGLIPIATPATGIDMVSPVQVLGSTEPSEIAGRISTVCDMPANELGELSHVSAQSFAERHDPTSYESRFRETLKAVGFSRRS